jgi:hypothetical protein
MMDAPYQGGRDVHVLPASPALPGVGVLPVNAYVLLAQEPVLVDTGLAVDEDQFIDALASVIDPAALRWVWLTHDDADHTGNIQRVLEVAPNARLVTNGFCAMRMATWWPIPLDRVHAITVGDAIDVGSPGRPDAVRRCPRKCSPPPAAPYLLIPPAGRQWLVPGALSAGPGVRARRRTVRSTEPRAVQASRRRPDGHVGGDGCSDVDGATELRSYG